MKSSAKIKITYVNQYSNVVEMIIKDDKVLNAVIGILESVGVHYTLEKV